MVAMKAFCDGSGNADTSPFVVLAGVTSEESEWAFFENEWGRILRDRYPIAPYLHMKEIVLGKGPFRDENGWDDAKRVQLVQDCLVFSQKLDKRKFCTFICSIDMRMYRHIRDKGFNLPSVSRICNKFVPQAIFKWYLDKFSQWELAELYYTFDQNERFIGPFRTLVTKCQKKSWSGLYNHWDIIKQMAPADMRNALPLQLADMIAWAHHRRLTPHREGLAWSHLGKLTDSVHPFYRKEVGKNELVGIAKYLHIGTVVEDYLNSLTFPPVNLPD
jgi:hypothetical protein